MSEIYTVIVGILGILAVSGLFVGVTNDAVNFLNSAIGSKAALDEDYPHRGVRRHHHRRGHVERHDGGRPQRHVQPRTVHLPRSDDALPGRHVRQRHPAGPLQFVGTPDLDHRIADLLPAGRSDRRVYLQNLERPGTERLLARTLHQHLARHGYRFGHPAVGGDRLHLRHAGHVRLAHDLFVPLHGAFPPLRIALVRGLADGDRLLRRLQGSQIHTRGPCLHPADRQPPALGHRHLLGGLLAAAVLHPAFQSQHPAHHDPFGNLRAGPRLRGQRPGELHRRARGRVRRLHHRPGSGRHADAHGRAERECPGQFPDPADGGHPDDPHAVDFEEGHARLRNRAFALGAGRRRPASSTARRSSRGRSSAQPSTSAQASSA